MGENCLQGWMSQDPARRMGVMASAAEALGRLTGICKDEQNAQRILNVFEDLSELMGLPLHGLSRFTPNFTPLPLHGLRAPSSTSSASAASHLTSHLRNIVPVEVRCSINCGFLQMAMGQARADLKKRQQLRGGSASSASNAAAPAFVNKWPTSIDHILQLTWAADWRVECEKTGGIHPILQDSEAWNRLSVLLLGSMQLAEQFIEFSNIKDGIDLGARDFNNCLYCWEVRTDNIRKTGFFGTGCFLRQH